MITDEQSDFIERLTKTGQFDELYGKILAYAARRLPRRAGVRDEDAPREAANEAFARLFSDDYAAWRPDELSVEALIEFLEGRVDDVVKNYWRTRKRDRKIDRFDTLLHDDIEDVVESQTYTQALKEAWLNRATERDEKVGEIVLEWLGDNISVDGQAEALGVDRGRVYRLRTVARDILNELISEQEIVR